MSNTHINTFIRDAEEAYQTALHALGEFKTAADKLRARFEADMRELRGEEPVAGQQIASSASGADTADKAAKSSKKDKEADS